MQHVTPRPLNNPCNQGAGDQVSQAHSKEGSVTLTGCLRERLYHLKDAVTSLFEEFPACTLRVVPLGFRNLLTDPRGIHWPIQGLHEGHIRETF